MGDKDQVIAAGLRDGAVELGCSSIASIIGDSDSTYLKRHVERTLEGWNHYRRKLVDEKGRWLVPEKIAPMGEMRIPFWSRK